MSKNDMVMVPRTSLEDVLSIDVARTTAALDSFRAALNQPAQQHQREPVTLPVRKHETGDVEYDERNGAAIDAWNACLDEIAKLGPLYGRPVQAAMWQKAFNVAIQERDTLRGDVETMRRKNNENWHESEAMRAQLVEAHGLLREWAEMFVGGIKTSPLGRLETRTVQHLSASAEPKCGKCHGRGLLRIATVCGPADKICPDCASAEPSAPVEIDERAALEAYCTKIGLPLDRLPSGEYLIPATRFVSQGWHAHAAANRKL